MTGKFYIYIFFSGREKIDARVEETEYSQTDDLEVKMYVFLRRL